MSKDLRFTLVFDGWCRFCTLSVALIKRMDFNDRITLFPYQSADRIRPLGLTLEECKQAAWAIDSSGKKYRGAGAINAALGAAWNMEWPNRLYQSRLVGPLQDLIYDMVARYRRYLPGLVPHCERYPGDCQ